MRLTRLRRAGVARLALISMISSLFVSATFVNPQPAQANTTRSTGNCSLTYSSNNFSIATSGSSCIATFNASGAVQLSPANPIRLSYVVAVGGGGGGGNDGGSGGTGGQLRYLSTDLILTANQTVTVGSGGAGAVHGGAGAADGNDSSFASLIFADGGKAGVGGSTSRNNPPSPSGGSGGTALTQAYGGFGGGTASGNFPGESGQSRTEVILGIGNPGGGSGGANSTTNANGGMNGGTPGGGKGGGLTTVNGSYVGVPGGNGSTNTGGGGGGGPSGLDRDVSDAQKAGGNGGSGIVRIQFEPLRVPPALIVSTTGPHDDGVFVDGQWFAYSTVSTIRLNPSDVVSRLAAGPATLVAGAGSLTVESHVISSFANNLTLKATTDVVINPGVEIDVGAGDLVLWSDTGNSGTGRIALNAGSELKTNGGDITIGGGANPASGYSIGRYGLYMENGSIDAGSGSVIINGRSNGSVDSSIGVSILSQSSIVGGSVSISGHISANATTAANSFGIRLANSVISASQVVLDGRDVSGTSKTGIQHWGLYLMSSTISAGVQGAQLTGVGSNSTGSDIFGTAIISSTVDALQGPIRINGQAGSNGSGNKSGLRISNSTIGKKATDVELIATGGTGFGLDASGVVVGSNSTTTNLSISATAISQSTPLVFNTLGGDFSVRPLGASFTKAFTNDLFDVSGVNNYTIGPDGRSGGVAIKEGISVSGQVNVTAREIDIRSSISSITGPVVLKATQKVSMRSNVDIRTGGQDIVLWGDSAQANFGNVELLGSNSLQSNGGDIYLAGGADDGVGKPAGFAVVTNPTSEGGVRLGSGYEILSDGGDVFLRGRAKLSAAGDADGVHLNGHGIIDSGAGSISISGELDGIFGFDSDAVAFRLGTSGPDQTQHQIRSQNSGPTALQISGDASSDSSGAASGIGSSNTHDRAGRLAVSIEAPGAITIHGRGSSAAFFSQLGSDFFGAGIRLNSTLISSSSTVSLTATKGSQDAEKTWGIEFDALPSQGVTSVVSAGTDITIGSDSITFSNVAIAAPGSIILEPLGSSFVSSGSTLPLLTNGLAQVPQSLRIGKSGNSGGVSLPANLEVANEIKIFAGKVESSADISTSDLAISSTDQIVLTGDVGFDRLEAASSKAGLTSGDIVIASTRSYLVADLDSSFVGSYGVPKVLEFLPLPSSATEDTAFELAARVGKDAYGFPMQSLNRTPASFAIAKAAGSGTLAGTLNANVLGADVHTFSDLVLSDVPNAGSSTSFTISGTDLTSTTSGLLHFFNLPSGDATLSSLGVGSGALTPNFGSATRSYQVTVPNGTTSITFTPTANNADHQQIEIIYTGGAEVVTSGQASSGLTLTYGLNTFAIRVTAENGSTSSYTVTVYRQLTQQVDWDYGNVSITQPNGSVSTASAFTDVYGDSRTSALSNDVSIDEDGLPVQTITLRVGEVLYLPMTSNYGNSLGYGGISGSENHICKILSFNKASDSRSGAYTIQAMKAGTCTGAFVTSYQRSVMVAMMTLGARGVEWPGGYYRTPYVNIVVERAEQTEAAVFNGPSSDSSTAVWNQTQTLEIQSSGRLALGDKSYTKVSGPCTVTTLPFVLGGRNYFFMARAQVVAAGTGTCVLEGRQEADSIFEAKTWSHTITFTQATQTLAFTSNVPAEPVVGSGYSPTATSSAMLPVTLAVTTGNGTVCTISSGVVSFIATGSCTIQATQAGDSNYLAAPTITQTLVVGTANQSITFNEIPDKELGDVAFRAMANASSGLAVSFTTVTSNTICTVSTAGLVTIVGEGQCSVTANQAGNSQVGAAQSVTRVFTIRPEGSSAPFITAVSYGDGSLTATLIAPTFTGGNSILDYSLFAYNASNQNVALVTGCDASATPVRCTITGLTNGQPYTLKAAARTSVGLGNLSAASRVVIPLANPQAVNGLTALAGNQTLSITWQPPSSLGGGDFARFDIRIRPAGGNFPGLSSPSATISSITESSYVFTGLQNGVSYDVEMITITTEPASAMNPATLQSHTARVIQTPFTRPNAPRNLAAFEVDNTVKIAFAYPDFDGGRQVDEYRVSVNGTTVCTPAQIQVCSVPKSTLTSLLSSPFVGGIGFQQQPGSLGFLSTTTQIPITVVAVNEGGTSDPATTTYNLVTGSSTPPASSGGGVVGSITNLPTITSYSKQVLQSTGDSFSITGTNFALITEIWASNTKLSFVRSEENVIRITTPELAVGPHSLILRGSFGVVTVQDAVSVIEGRIVGESTRITRTFVDGFTGRSTYLGPTNVAKLRSFVAGVKPGTLIKCYGSIPDRAKMDNIKLAFKRADRVCDFVQSLNPNIEVIRTWVWKDGNEAWDRSQVRLTLFEY